MFRKIAVAVVLVIAGFALFVTLRPADFRLERSASLAAPPAAVFAQINDFHAWTAWSPWERLDPAMKKTFTGPTAGAGAGYAWVGNKEVGEGRMTILESQPAKSVVLRLEFIKPFAATNETRFELVPSGEGTRVTWAMTGHNDFVGKLVGLFMDMDKMVGPDFERGLAALGVAAGKAPK